jgi:hypothetical protein
MSDQIKISQEELNSLLDLRERIRTNVESIGRLNIKRHFTQLEIDQTLGDLDQAYSVSEDLSMEENRVVQEITAKYGEGDLDFNTGTYTPKQK